jgi:hypothetical protein
LATPEWQANEGNDSFLWSKLNDKPELLEQLEIIQRQSFKIE